MYERVPKIGDVYRVRPEFCNAEKCGQGHAESVRMNGRVVYVHPQFRFAVLDFGVYGVSIRESFFPEKLTGNAGR